MAMSFFVLHLYGVLTVWQVHIGYLPTKKIIGLSKLARSVLLTVQKARLQ